MSDSALKKAVQDAIKIAQKRKEGSKKKNPDSEARDIAQKYHGQILLLNKYEINATLTKRFGVTLSDEQLDEVFDGPIDAELMRRQNAIKWESDQDRKDTFYFLNKLQRVRGDKAYVISNFEAAKTSKYKASNKGNDVISILTNYIKDQTGKEGLEKEQVSRAFQLGHGDRGAASSEFGLARAVSIAAENNNLTKEQKQQLYTVILKQREKHKLITKVNHSQMFTSGGVFSKEFRFVISYQDKEMNSEEGELERAAMAGTLQEWDILGMETSTLVPDAIGSILTAALTPKRGKGTGKHKIKEASKASVPKNISSVVAKPYSVVKGIKPSNIKLPKATSKMSASTFRLAALINQKLSDTVRKNMGPPGLENVTGRFADSVRVTDVATTRKGYPSIGYTYMRNPYQVFETGLGKAGWASTERDPRKLIDASIREIAAEMAIGRFYTRRQ
jgi:hypothetical protein